jgi:hypothetical protein
VPLVAESCNEDISREDVMACKFTQGVLEVDECGV